MKLELNKITITHVLLMYLVLHAFVISFPEDWLVFDEGLFSWASRTLLEGEDRTPYQMPGLHVIGAISISLMGDDWFSLSTNSGFWIRSIVSILFDFKRVYF